MRAPRDNMHRHTPGEHYRPLYYLSSIDDASFSLFMIASLSFRRGFRLGDKTSDENIATRLAAKLRHYRRELADDTEGKLSAKHNTTLSIRNLSPVCHLPFGRDAPFRSGHRLDQMTADYAFTSAKMDMH